MVETGFSRVATTICSFLSVVVTRLAFNLKMRDIYSSDTALAVFVEIGNLLALTLILLHFLESLSLSLPDVTAEGEILGGDLTLHVLQGFRII